MSGSRRVHLVANGVVIGGCSLAIGASMSTDAQTHGQVCRRCQAALEKLEAQQATNSLSSIAKLASALRVALSNAAADPVCDTRARRMAHVLGYVAGVAGIEWDEVERVLAAPPAARGAS